MENLNKKPARYKGGLQRPRKASELNAILDALYEQISGSGISKYGDKLVVNAPDKEDTIGVLGIYDRYFVVDEEYDDVLKVAPYNFGIYNQQKYDSNLANNCLNNTEDERMYIAKPHILQRTMWDGMSINYGGLTVEYDYGTGVIGKRIASSSTVSETQYITPPYFRGEIIVARDCPTQLSYNVVIDSETIEVQIILIDTNSSGRVWATECA